MSDTPRTVKRWCGWAAAGTETAAMNRMVEAHGDHDEDTPYVLASDYDALERELAAAKERITEWELAAKNWMATPEASTRLDGYRELAAKCATLEERAEKAEAERDALTKADLPLSKFGDILGHNYWMDANTIRGLWRRMVSAAIDAARAP